MPTGNRTRFVRKGTKVDRAALKKTEGRRTDPKTEFLMVTTIERLKTQDIQDPKKSNGQRKGVSKLVVESDSK